MRVSGRWWRIVVLVERRILRVDVGVGVGVWLNGLIVSFLTLSAPLTLTLTLTLILTLIASLAIIRFHLLRSSTWTASAGRSRGPGLPRLACCWLSGHFGFAGTAAASFRGGAVSVNVTVTIGICCLRLRLRLGLGLSLRRR